jgi:hypothetical protein
VSAGSVGTFFGDVSGFGTYTGTGTKFFEGSFSPGSSPGMVSDEGDSVFGSRARVRMEIGGASAGDGYDRYDVAGLLGLGGLLEVVLLDGYAPQAGDVFDLFDWGALSGGFDDIDLAGAVLGEGLAWDLGRLYVDGSLAVTAVPLPAAAWLMMGVLPLLRSRRSG